LEDFFLLGKVKTDRIEECIQWMNENPNIAECRLAVSNDIGLRPTAQYKDFYTAGNDVGYRLDTQFALWDKETLLSFLDLSENPWKFEENGTKRILNSDKIFLWKYDKNDFDLENMIVPYRNDPKYGFGIAWGNWLWNNPKWFKENEIYNVDLKKLGVLSKRCVKRRFRFLYVQNPGFAGKIIQHCYRIPVRFGKVLQNIRIYGWKAGMKESIKALQRNK
jgi:hypothetical protein